MEKNRLVLLGDVHGNYCYVETQYNKITHDFKKGDLIVQLGDFGFEQDWYKAESYLSEYLRILPGNHDDYNYLKNNQPKVNLGNFGFFKFNNKKIFYVRGAYSIDKLYRLEYEKQNGIKIWWPNEELSIEEADQAFELYKECKPDIVLSHTAPYQIKSKILVNLGFNPTQCFTSSLLSKLFSYHQPKFWYFGHFHSKEKIVYENCTFVCLDINQLLEVRF